MKYKNELKEYRKHLWLTQQEVATQAKIPLRSYQSYEQGERLPNVKVGMRIAKALKSYCDELNQSTRKGLPAPVLLAEMSQNLIEGYKWSDKSKAGRYKSEQKKCETIFDKKVRKF